MGAGVAGAVVTRSLPGLISRVAPVPTTGATGLAIRAAAGLVAGHLVGKFMGAQVGEDFAFGALISVGDEAFHLYAAPSLGLSSYLAPSMGTYLAPGANLPRALPPSRGLHGVPTPTRFDAAKRF